MMTDIVKRDFFEILRASIWGKDFNRPVDNLDSVMLLAKRQGLLPLFAEFAVIGNLGRLSDDQMSGLTKFLYVNMVTHDYIDNILVKVAQMLDSNGIPYVLLKGEGLAALYPKPDLRTCGDIDFLVDEKYFEKSKELINQMADEKSRCEGFQSGKHYHVVIRKIGVEIHFRSVTMPTKKMQAIYSEYENESLTKLEPDYISVCGIKIPLFDPTFNIFFTFYHAWHHLTTSGVGFRHLCDVAILLYRKKNVINIERLEKILRSLNLMQVWQTFLYILVDYLGLNEKSAPFYSQSFFVKMKANRIVNIIFSEGNFGQNKKSKSRVKSIYIRMLRFINVFSLFPSFTFKQYVCLIKSRFQ